MRARINASIAVLFLALLSPFQIPVAHAAVAAGVGVVENGLIFDFDAANPNAGTGSSLANLVTSNSGITSTLQSGVTRSSANGNTYSFDGTSTSYATISIGSTNFSSGFSLSFYAKFTTAVANNRTFERIIDFASAASGSGLDAADSMWVGRFGDTTDLGIEAWNGRNRPGKCRGSNAIQLDTFAHYVVTLNGNICTFYVNKVAVTTNYYYSNDVLTNSAGANIQNPPVVNRTSAFIGKSNWPDYTFKGEIGDIAMYNTVLDQSAVNQNFIAQTDTTAPTYTGNATFAPNENQTPITSLTTSESVTFIPVSGSGDTQKFSLSGSSLSFISAPNYEAPNPSNTLTYYFKLLDLNGNPSLNTYVVTINVQDIVESTTLTFPTLSATPYKGLAVTITVTPTGDGTSIPGKVSYLIGGKRIPTCYKKAYTGTGSSTCTFDPALRGNQEISVTFTPTNTNFTSATSKKSFFIYKRATTR